MKQSLRLLTATVWLLFFPIGLLAQERVVEALVKDAETGAPLPFASIYVSPGKSTISNADGYFRLVAGEADSLRVSYVGFQTQTLRAAAVGSAIVLRPYGLQLDEVVVRPLALKDILKETLRQMRKYYRKRANFFYRQTAFVDSTCYEVAEAFLSGFSAVSLKELRLLRGRYAGIRADSLQAFSFYKNFYTFSQIELASKEDIPPGWQDVMPLFAKATEYYDIDYNVMYDEERTVYAIRFSPKPKLTRPILDCTLYVDATTLHVLRCDGSGRNFNVLQTYPEALNKPKEVLPVEFDFNISMTEQNGFVEVLSVYVDTRHVVQGQTVHTKSILFNTGPRRNSGGDVLGFYGNLHQSIEDTRYDAKFWNENETVLRTPTEEAVVRLFERQDLFGVFQ